MKPLHQINNTGKTAMYFYLDAPEGTIGHALKLRLIEWLEESVNRVDGPYTDAKLAHAAGVSLRRLRAWFKKPPFARVDDTGKTIKVFKNKLARRVKERAENDSAN